MTLAHRNWTPPVGPPPYLMVSVGEQEPVGVDNLALLVGSDF